MPLATSALRGDGSTYLIWTIAPRRARDRHQRYRPARRLRAAAASLRLRRARDLVTGHSSGSQSRVETLELCNLAANALATVAFRIERCGAYARKDFPDRDDQVSLAHTLAWADGLERAPGTRPVCLDLSRLGALSEPPPPGATDAAAAAAPRRLGWRAAAATPRSWGRSASGSADPRLVRRPQRRPG